MLLTPCPIKVRVNRTKITVTQPAYFSLVDVAQKGLRISMNRLKERQNFRWSCLDGIYTVRYENYTTNCGTIFDLNLILVKNYNCRWQPGTLHLLPKETTLCFYQLIRHDGKFL